MTDLSTSTKNGLHRAADSAHRTVDRLAGSAHSAVDRMRGGMDDARVRADDMGHDLAVHRDEWMGQARDTVRNHPIVAIGVALGVGWLLAAWMRR